MTNEQFNDIDSLIPKTSSDAIIFIRNVTLTSWIECIELLNINLKNELDYATAINMYQKACAESFILINE